MTLPESESDLSEVWRKESREYVSAINAFVAEGERTNWENPGEQPTDERERLAEAVIESVRRANESGNQKNLRERFPTAHSPFIELLDGNGQHIEPIALLDDGQIVARIGTSYTKNYVVQIDGDTATRIDGIELFGRCPNRRYFAVLSDDTVQITDGWLGPVVTDVRMPTGEEGLPQGVEVESYEPSNYTQMTPFPDGQRVLAVSQDGIFVLEPDRVTRLTPTKESIAAFIADDDDKDALPELAMAHGSISRSGKWIALGDQMSKHLVFDSDYNLAADIGHTSEYPHLALFSDDDSILLLNSCHFYDGESIGVPVRLLPGLSTERYERHKQTAILQGGARAYAGVATDDKFIIGDANGYAICFDKTGKPLWQHFVGSSTSAMDISADGKTMIMSTYAGFLSIIDVDTGTADPYTIGTSTNVERRRWLFWKRESRPLIW